MVFRSLEEEIYFTPIGVEFAKKKRKCYILDFGKFFGE